MNRRLAVVTGLAGLVAAASMACSDGKPQQAPTPTYTSAVSSIPTPEPPIHYNKNQLRSYDSKCEAVTLNDLVGKESLLTFPGPTFEAYVAEFLNEDILPGSRLQDSLMIHVRDYQQIWAPIDGTIKYDNVDVDGIGTMTQATIESDSGLVVKLITKSPEQIVKTQNVQRGNYILNASERGLFYLIVENNGERVNPVNDLMVNDSLCTYVDGLNQ